VERAVKGFVVWFTGMSGAGKSTLAGLVAAELRHRGVHVEVLDGDEVRTHLSKGLGFSREDRDTNVLRIGFVAKVVARSGACAMTATISPYRATRDTVRASVDRFVEVFVHTPLEELKKRDPKGLYAKAARGEIENLTGVSDPYEPPLSPEIEIDTSKLSKEECVATILRGLDALGLLEETHEPSLPFPHGGELAVPKATPDQATRGTIHLDDFEAGWLTWMARGFVSPVRGFLGARDGAKVRKEGRLETGVHFPIDLALVRKTTELGAIDKGDLVALVAKGQTEGTALRMEVTELEADGDRTRIAGELRAPSEEGAATDDAATGHAIPDARTARDRVCELVRGTLRPRICGLIATWGAEGQATAALSKRLVDVIIRFADEAADEREIVLPTPPRAHRDADPSADLTREDVLLRAIVLKNAGATHVALPRVLQGHVSRAELIDLDLDVLVL
jgi:adenylyl-sulfate kinase